VDPAWGDGFMHYTEGWALFLVAFGILGLLAWMLAAGEKRLALHRGPDRSLATA